jgi:hypothetical protein
MHLLLTSVTFAQLAALAPPAAVSATGVTEVERADEWDNIIPYNRTSGV